MSKIAVQNLVYEYKDNGKVFRALDNLSFHVEAGDFVCLIGHSGCGKTTLLNLIAGLLVPSSGKILIDEKSVTGPGLDRHIVFQHYSLFPWLTARDNVAFGLRREDSTMSKKEARTQAVDFLKTVELGEVADKYPFQLSGGMQQRVAIARAFAMSSDIMLLDEPFGAVDPRMRENLQQELQQLWQKGEKKKTIIFVTHDMSEAILLADRILFMEPGKICRCIAVDLDRPRRESSLAGTAEYCSLRSQIIHLFNQS